MGNKQRKYATAQPTKCILCEKPIKGIGIDAICLNNPNDGINQIYHWECLERSKGIKTIDDDILEERQRIIRSLMPLVRDECCNYISGECIVLGGGLGEMQECRLYRGERCKYFERSVMPLGDPKYSHASSNYVEKYGMKIKNYKHNIFREATKEARACKDCGKPLPSRHSYCAQCKKKRQKDSQRKRRRN